MTGNDHLFALLSRRLSRPYRVFRHRHHEASMPPPIKTSRTDGGTCSVFVAPAVSILGSASGPSR
jgi:hypothetical protein